MIPRENRTMATSTKHPSSEPHLQAAAHHAAAAHHHLEAAHHHNVSEHDQAKQHAEAALQHSEQAHKHTTTAHQHSQKWGWRVEGPGRTRPAALGRLLHLIATGRVDPT